MATHRVDCDGDRRPDRFGREARWEHIRRGGARPAARCCPASAAATPSRPNILLMIADDQTWSTFNRSADAERLLATRRPGHALRSRRTSTRPLCCPSRSQIFTGLYAHEHERRQATAIRSPARRSIQALHDSGYRTLLAGKYLNSHPCTTPLTRVRRVVLLREGEFSRRKTRLSRSMARRSR